MSEQKETCRLPDPTNIKRQENTASPQAAIEDIHKHWQAMRASYPPTAGRSNNEFFLRKVEEIVNAVLLRHAPGNPESPKTPKKPSQEQPIETG